VHEFYAGYGESEITPPLGVELCGYGYYLGRRAERVQDPLKARAVCLSTEKDSVILVSCDLIGLTVQWTDALRKKISDEYGLPFENVMLSCTHTHTGPATMPLEGCGEPAPESYMEKLPGLIMEAVRKARDDRKKAALRSMCEAIAPFGYNRRNRTFEPIDPALKVLALEREDRKIYVVNFACHAVTLGPRPEISADWPGAVAAAFERRGEQCLVFQGFCGDIDPVCHLNSWGKGTPETLRVYGEMVRQQASLAEGHAVKDEEIRLLGRETRIKLPLEVFDIGRICAEKEKLLTREKGRPEHERIIRKWAAMAEEKQAVMQMSPWVDNFPVQVVTIGKLSMLGLPGEVFCEYALKLKQTCPGLFTIGYAGGNVGYLPVAGAYAKQDDYACYAAPKIYQVFPFKPGVEEIILDACRTLLVE